jgi:hypothetical protein
MFRYLVITRNRLQFEIEEESGTILYRTREFLRLLKDRYPEVVFARFKGKPTMALYRNLDLVLIAPHSPPSALLGQMIDGYLLQLLNTDDPAVQVRLARHEFKIELCGRKRRDAGGEILLAQTFETRSKKLVALLRTDTVDPRWLRGTSARVTPNDRFAFFISTNEKEAYRGRRGTVHAGGGGREEEDNR